MTKLGDKSQNCTECEKRSDKIGSVKCQWVNKEENKIIFKKPKFKKTHRIKNYDILIEKLELSEYINFIP